MARGNLPNCLKIVLEHEGGYVDHPRDPGGATNLGVTLATLSSWRGRMATKADVRALTQRDVEPIYEQKYWNVVRGDDLPYGVDLAVFDFGVNSGPARSGRYLQAVVGAVQDGKVGPSTLGMVRRMDGKYVVQKLCARRLSFVRGLRTWATFGRGWSRRIADIEARGVAMWMVRETATSPVNQASVLNDEARAAHKKSETQGKSVVGVGAGSGAGIVAVDNVMMLGVIVAVALVAAVVLAVKSRQNDDRYEAYARVAREVAA